MKKLLITGVSGFIGKHLYDYFSGAYQVYGIARNNPGSKNCFAVNMLDKNELRAFFKNGPFDTVIHLAAITATQNNLNDPALLMNNLTLSVNLAEALKENTTAHLVNFSSSSVYANNAGVCNEDSMPDPSGNTDGLYGLSKYSAEVLFNFLLKNTAVTHLRIPMVYGKGMEESRMHTAFSRELKEKNEITVFGEGKRIISHISIEELIEKLKTIMQEKITGTFNVSGQSLSTLELAENIIAAEGNSDSRIVKVKKGSVDRFILDGHQLNALINKLQK
jgi:nucleoside-diphosphate-sugar epimerase